MSVVIWILAGALLGFAAHALTRNRNRSGITLNVFTGIAGVVFSGWLLGVFTSSPAFIRGEFSPASFFVSLMGATVLLTALQVFRSRRSTTTQMRELT
jgi:uncharacterized membrane protein YeaQ/YmgE (transglycosylase-associated protein family)